MKPGRVPCCVPFCGRTAADHGQHEEIICGPHWRLVRPSLRRRLARVRRRYRAGVLRGDFRTAERAFRLDCTIWQAIKREAIEIAAGIAG